MPVVGSAALAPQLAPPNWPGSMMFSRASDGGVNTPSLRAARNRFSTLARDAGSRCGLMSLAVKVRRPNGSGRVGNGCVGQACSPGMSLAGTGRSSIGHSGWPVTRSNTKSWPVLVGCATMSTIRPSWRTVINFGAAARS